MNKGVKQVRKAIMKRKKNQTAHARINKPSVDRQIAAFLPEEEERHGFYPSITDINPDKNRSGKKYPQFSGMILKGMLSVALFMGTAILWQSESAGDKFGLVKQWTNTAMTKEFPFAKVNQVYRETFGSPFSFRTQKVDKSDGANSSSIPVFGDISETFQENGHGVMIAPAGSAKVNSMEDGIVIFAGKDKDTRRTVIVQHADNSQSTYGYLSDIKVHLYQYVQKDEQLGEFKAGQKAKNVYFSIEKNNEYIDPMPVIKVNDNH